MLYIRIPAFGGMNPFIWNMGFTHSISYDLLTLNYYVLL